MKVFTLIIKNFMQHHISLILKLRLGKTLIMCIFRCACKSLFFRRNFTFIGNKFSNEYKVFAYTGQLYNHACFFRAQFFNYKKIGLE